MPKYSKRHRDLLFTVRKSIRYHNYRHKFYLWVQSVASFMALVMGSTAFANLTELAGWNRWLAFCIAVLSAIVLVFRVIDKAILHHDLYRRFIHLERKFLAISGNDELDTLHGIMLEIEADEPPIYSALNRFCHNEVLKSEGQYNYLQPLHWHHRMLKNLWDFDNLPIMQGSRVTSGADQ